MYKTSNFNSVGTCAELIGAGTHFEKNILNRFKRGYGWEILACSLHRDLRTWSRCCVGPLPITRA